MGSHLHTWHRLKQTIPWTVVESTESETQNHSFSTALGQRLPTVSNTFQIHFRPQCTCSAGRCIHGWGTNPRPHAGFSLHARFVPLHGRGRPSPALPFQHIKLKERNLLVHLWSGKQFRCRNSLFAADLWTHWELRPSVYPKAGWLCPKLSALFY